MKRTISLLLALAAACTLTACGNTNTEITVFAAASMQESLDQAIAAYESSHENVSIAANYDSSGTLKTQIENGAECDLFISAAPKQMDQLTELELVNTQTRIDLLENKVVLAVPEGNPAGIMSFDQMSQALSDGTIHLAIGNSDVPVGQYTQKIFEFYHLDEAALSSYLTYGSNVKEVTTQVSEAAVDCGIIYATDAFSAGLDFVDEATVEMCGQVIYPAALIQTGTHADAAQDFLDYLTSDAGMAYFTAVGFSPMA